MGQKAKVTFDSGSSWLTVKACVTKTHCHEGEKKEFDTKTGGYKKDPKQPKKQLELKKTDVAYHANKTITGWQANSPRHPLSYGSADLEGFRW